MKTQDRKTRLMPGGSPRYVRCYDFGDDGTIDRYTVLFTGRYHHKTGGAQIYLAMNAAPFHPQGFGQHGGASGTMIDCDRWGFPPKIGGKCHLGKRIAFSDLPPDCQKLVLRDYADLWDIG